MRKRPRAEIHLVGVGRLRLAINPVGDGRLRLAINLVGDGRLRQHPVPPGGSDGWLRRVQIMSES